ncbi:MAG: flagellar hook-associated protein FlgK [Hydrogenophilales bacterium CG_4_9_14_3_um_filter_59_35]|nr:MAG: flagellar hook-associated protein FlgK [Hydrogenophilales bacterium CG18_big_fil_WC_8_21_14_2_50_58_12]PIY00206.1 MAG: flagellar hook-associated protein FlgK [Hydrogenophilales bacterium CG_4_10_14_3_um_filter_58_23]PJB06063.1 MAG: flagellar hook-associated protein FlgK [Hydrogenophilales bacterium CG_4_9_14_3_um_filter_59_35]
MSIYSIGVSALATAQAGLLTTEHNISNVNTPGFNRQQVVQSTNIAQYSGSGFFGQGTHVDTVKRIYDQMLNGQLMQAQTQSSQLESYSAQITQLDNMLADPNAGVSPALQDFFNGVQDVAANPASIPSRQAMLSGAQTMVARFQSIDQRFTEIRDGVNSEVRSSVGVINSYAKQIANLNQSVAIAQGSASSQQPANDLLDQRDQLIGELNQIVKVSTVKQDDGSLNVFIGNGQTLVLGAQPFTLGAAPSLEDPERIDVGMSVGGSTILLSRGSLTGGSLGGLLAFREETLAPAQNALGRVAIGLAQTFNDQHQLGMDLNGNLGTDFFNVAAPKVIPNTGNPTGTTSPTVTFNNVSAVTTSDYKLSYNGASWSLINQATNQPVTMTGLGTVGSPYLADGLSIVAPTPSGPASFLIKPTINGARDVSVKLTDTSKIAAAAPIETSATLLNTGSGTISAGSVNLPPPPNANLQDNVTIAFIDAIHFSVTDNTTATVLAASVVYNPAAGATLTYNGWTMQISGTPATGDTFTVGTNAGGVADNRNALLLAGLQTQNTLVGGTTTYQGAYSQLVSFVGNKTREVEVTAKAQTNLLSQVKQAQQSISGVNLDEEAANLLRYQQAYQAAGKMMQIASTLFDTLLSLGK